MWQLGAGSELASERPRLRRAGPLRESPRAGPSRLRITRPARNRPELGALPPQIGKAALRWRSELPPGSGRRVCGAARGPPLQGALLAQRLGCPVLVPPQPRRPRSPLSHRLAPVALAAHPAARQLGSAPPAPPPNCRLLRQAYRSALQRYPSCSRRTRCTGPAPLLSRLGGGSRRRLEAGSPPPSCSPANATIAGS